MRHPILHRSLCGLLLLLAALACQPAGADKNGDEHGEEHSDEHGDEHGDEGEEGVVKLSAAALERSGIRVEPAATGVLQGSLEIPAEIHLNPDRVAHISPLVEGQLLSVSVTVGDKVEPGQALAELRSVALGQGRAELIRTTAMQEGARKNLKRQEQLRAEGISSERSLIDARFAFEGAAAEHGAALSRLRVFGVQGGAGPDMTLSSPIQGVVLERHATRGENVSPQDNIFIITDLSKVWVIGRVYEQQIAQLRPGMQATLTLNAYPGQTWRGKVDFIGAALEEETRTLPIRVELDNTDGLLRPGLFGALRLSTTAGAADAVIVPEAATQQLEGRTVVFVPGEHPGEFMARPVTLGRASYGQVEIIEGLPAGSPLVVQGSFVLKSELMRASLGHGHAH